MVAAPGKEEAEKENSQEELVLTLSLACRFASLVLLKVCREQGQARYDNKRTAKIELARLSRRFRN